jgi:hypothetical protein
MTFGYSQTIFVYGQRLRYNKLLAIYIIFEGIIREFERVGSFYNIFNILDPIYFSLFYNGVLL